MIFFINIGYNLQSTFPNTTNDDFSKYLDFNEKSAFFKPMTSNEIIDIVNGLKSNTSPGYDGIDVKVVKKLYM